MTLWIFSVGLTPALVCRSVKILQDTATKPKWHNEIVLFATFSDPSITYLRAPKSSARWPRLRVTNLDCWE
jgi:hypothetical protein